MVLISHCIQKSVKTDQTLKPPKENLEKKNTSRYRHWQSLSKKDSNAIGNNDKIEQMVFYKNKIPLYNKEKISSVKKQLSDCDRLCQLYVPQGINI